MVTFELAHKNNESSSPGETSFIIVDKTEFPSDFNFSSLGSINHPEYEQSFEQLFGKLLVVIEGHLMAEYSFFGQEALEVVYGEDGNLSILEVSENENGESNIHCSTVTGER